MATSSLPGQPAFGRPFALAAAAGLIVLLLVGAGLFYAEQARTLDQVRQENAGLAQQVADQQRSIDGLNGQVAQLQRETSEARASATAANDKMAKARQRVEVLDEVMKLGRAASASRGTPPSPEQRAATLQLLQKAGALNDPTVTRIMASIGDPNARGTGEEFMLHMLASLRDELR